jgi:hypothetical protein
MKMKPPKGKKVKGQRYSAADEEYDKKEAKKLVKGMSTAGMAKELQLSEKEQGYSKMVRVKPQKKNQKPISGKRKVY